MNLEYRAEPQKSPDSVMKSPGVPESLSVLDGLRGFAAIYVVVYHVRALLWVGWESFASNLWSHSLVDVILAFGFLVFRFGQEAVLLFFLLSGFVIHYRQANQSAAGQTPQLDLWRYSKRRLIRLCPPLIMALVLTALLDHFGLLINRGFYEGTNRPASITIVNGAPDNTLQTFIGNVLFLQGPVVPTFGTNSPLWSLSYEFYFYTLYPLFFVVYRRLGVRVALFLVIGLGLVSFYMTNVQGIWPWRIFIYFVVWSAGAACAELYARRIRVKWPWIIAIATALFAIIAFVVSARISAQLGVLLWGASFFFLFCYLLLPSVSTVLKSTLGHVLRTAAPTARFSYSLYVMHFPMTVFISAIYLRSHTLLPSNFNLVFLTAGLCILSAWFMAKFIEKPFVSRQIS